MYTLIRHHSLSRKLFIKHLIGIFLMLFERKTSYFFFFYFIVLDTCPLILSGLFFIFQSFAQFLAWEPFFLFKKCYQDKRTLFKILKIVIFFIFVLATSYSMTYKRRRFLVSTIFGLFLHIVDIYVREYSPSSALWLFIIQFSR